MGYATRHNESPHVLLGVLISASAFVCAVIAAANDNWYNINAMQSAGIYRVCNGDYSVCTFWHDTTYSDTIKNHAGAAAGIFTAGLILSGFIALRLVAIRIGNANVSLPFNVRWLTVESLLAAVLLVVGWAAAAGVRKKIEDEVPATTGLEDGYGLGIGAWAAQFVATLVFLTAKSEEPKAAADFKKSANLLKAAIVIVSASIALARPNWYRVVSAPSRSIGIIKVCPAGTPTATTVCWLWHSIGSQDGGLVRDLADASAAFHFAGLLFAAILFFFLLWGLDDGLSGGIKWRAFVIAVNSKASTVTLSLLSTILLTTGFGLGAGMHHKLTDEYTGVGFGYAYGLSIVAWAVNVLLTWRLIVAPAPSVAEKAAELVGVAPAANAAV